MTKTKTAFHFQTKNFWREKKVIAKVPYIVEVEQSQRVYEKNQRGSKRDLRFFEASHYRFLNMEPGVSGGDDVREVRLKKRPPIFRSFALSLF